MNLSFAEREILEKTDHRLVISLDHRRHIKAANNQFNALLSSAQNGSNFDEHILAIDRPLFQESCDLAVQNGPQTQTLALVDVELGLIVVQVTINHLEEGFLLVAEEQKEEALPSYSNYFAPDLERAGIWTYSPKSKQFHFSEGVRAIYGLKNKGLFSYDDFLKFYSDTERTKLFMEIDRLMSKEQDSFEFIGKCTLSKGEVKQVRTKARAIWHNKEIIEIQGVSSDITERIKQKEERKFWLEISKLALKGIKSGVFFHDLKTDQVKYGEELKRMLGLIQNSKNIPEAMFRQMILEEDRKAAYERHLEEVEKASPYYYNHYRLVHSNGDVNHYEVYAWKQFDEEGKAIRMIGNLIDVEDQYRAKAAERELLSNLQAVVNNGFTYTFLLDHEGTILHCDERSIQFVKHEFNVHPMDSKTRFIDVIPMNLKLGFEISFPKVLKGHTLSKVIPRFLFDGSNAWLNVRYSPIMSKENPNPKVLITMLDITEQKKSEEVNHYYKQKLEELVRLKEMLMSSAERIFSDSWSDLHQKISALSLLDKEDTLAFRHQVETLKIESDKIRQSSHVQLKNQLFNAERATLNFETISLQGYVQFSIKKQYQFATAKGLNIEFTSNCENGGRVEADLGLVQTVIDNLINSSIHLAKGKTISVLLEGQLEKVCLTVEESGTTQVQQLLGVDSKFMGPSSESLDSALKVCQLAMELLRGAFYQENYAGGGRKLILMFPRHQK